MSNSEDFEIKNGVLTRYNGENQVLVIPEGVVEIKKNTFAWSTIEEVVLPKSLRIIGQDAFMGCENLKSVVIPDGLTCIEDHAFFSSNIEEIQLPKTLQKIGNYAFYGCRKLKITEIPNLDTLQIGKGAFSDCNRMVDKNGMLILQNRLHCFSFPKKGEDSIVIPNYVGKIESGAINEWKKIHINMNIKCPIWEVTGTASTYGIVNSILKSDGSTISFRDDSGNIVAKIILATEDETAPKENGAQLSIAQNNHAFDFAGYDAYWASLGKKPNKIRVALTRLVYPYELSDEMREVYESFLLKQSLSAGQMLIDENNFNMLTFMSEKQLFSKTALPKLIDYASQQGKTEATMMLLAYQHTLPEKTPAAKKSPKNVDAEKSMWKKPKLGTHLVGRYMGTETHLEFPLEVEGVSVDGIANTAGATPKNYEKLVEVVIPEGYTYIGNKAFAGCKKLQRISLPSTLKAIGTQAFANCTSLKEIILRKEIDFKGKDIFKNAKIDLVLIETDKNTKLPPHLFFNSDIQNFVIVGGPFKSSGNVFLYTGSVMGGSYFEEDVTEGFPKAVYTNCDFSTLDIKGAGGINAKSIYTLSSFDESIVSDPVGRELISAEKSKKTKIINNADKIVETVEVDSIDFPNSVFVISEFCIEDEWALQGEIEKRGGTVSECVTENTNYVVVPDWTVTKNTKIKKAISLQKKGHNIAIIQAKELARHIR